MQLRVRQPPHPKIVRSRHHGLREQELYFFSWSDVISMQGQSRSRRQPTFTPDLKENQD